jgi:Fungal rhodopsin domain
MKRRFRITVWITIAFVFSSGLAFLIAALLQCIPISASPSPH